MIELDPQPLHDVYSLIDVHDCSRTHLNTSVVTVRQAYPIRAISLQASEQKNTFVMDEDDMFADLREAAGADSHVLDMVSIKEIVCEDRFKKFKALDREWQEYVYPSRS